jgi:glycosyltransferase involved in cell wall biosynthesis
MVSVVIPMRNEERHIAACLDSLLHQTYPSDLCEIIVVDGRSTDRSLEIVERLQQRSNNIRILDNPAAIVPTAMNIGIRHARGEIVIRADAHSTYPHNYIETCVETLARTGAENVGGPVVTVAPNGSFSARLVAAILSNRFGVGNSEFRTSTKEGFVDTVPFGAFRKELFERIGLFDETMGRNEDNEINARIRQSGGKIYLTPALTLNYFPRDTFSKLIKQNYDSSEWHLFTLRTHRRAMGLRHLLPACFLLVVLVLLITSFVSKIALACLGAMLGIYFLTAILFTIRSAQSLSPALMVALPFAFFIFHMSYGAGTIAGAKYLFWKPSTRPTR